MPIIWTDDEGRITTISYTPRDRGTVGGYDVDEIPTDIPEGKELRFDTATKEFIFVDPDTLPDPEEVSRLDHLEQVVDTMLGGDEDDA